MWIEHYPNPHRIYVGRRTKWHVHHFWHGCWITAFGIILIWTDWKDKPWRFMDDRDFYVTRKNPRAKA